MAVARAARTGNSAALSWLPVSPGGGMVTVSVGSGTRGSGGALSVLSGRSAVNTGGALMVERRRRSDHEWCDRHRMMSLDAPTTCHLLSFVEDSAIALL